MDTYDNIVNETLFATDISEAEEDKIINLFSQLVRFTYINNEHLEKGIMTGVLKITKHILEVDAFKDYSFHNSDLHMFYGWCEKEVNKLFELGNVDKDTQLMAKLVFPYPWNPVVPLYNPWTIANLFKFKTLDPYWVNAVRTSFLRNDLASSILFADVSVAITLDKNVTIFHNNLQFTKKMLKGMISDVREDKVDKETLNTVLVYLIALGYYTFKEDIYDENQRTAGVKYANKEAMNEIAKNMIDYAHTKYNITLSMDELLHTMSIENGELLHSTPFSVPKNTIFRNKQSK